jgi:hypothetical protein
MTTTDSAVTAVTSTGITATAVIFFRDAFVHMIPWLMASIPLILLDLNFGIKAARHRNEKVRLSKAVRGTFGKTLEYVAWVCFAATASLAFKITWVEWAVLGLVYANELISIIGNYLETKDIEFNLTALYRWVIKWAGHKAGQVVEDAEAAEIIKPKDRPRDAKGRFVKKEDKCTGCYL